MAFRLNGYFILSFLVLTAVFMSSDCGAYPTDDFERTHINRLEGYHYALQTKSGREAIVPGARLSAKDIHLRLKGVQWQHDPLDLERILDANLSRKITSLLDSRYTLGLVDLADPKKPRAVLYNASRGYSPASLGKVIIALGVFEALRELHPYDTSARENILKYAMVTADPWIISDTHEVPFWRNLTENKNPSDQNQAGNLFFRPLEVGDSANLWTFLDWMLSASSNAAATTVMKELVLIKEMGSKYLAASPASKNAVFAQLPPQHVNRLLSTITAKALQFSGLNPNKLAQGSFFTRTAKNRFGSSGSAASTMALLQLLIQLERGRLVDSFSSLELKHLLYATQGRVRYVAGRALADSAVYYKSGSIYKCSRSPCEEHQGNIYNLMNSIAIIEYPPQKPEVAYLVVLSSNDTTKNAALRHEELGEAIHNIMLQNLHQRKHS
jgi:hypothetical protein